MHESFLIYRRFYYLKLALWLMGLSLLAFLLHDPIGPVNGGTWLGYTLGTISALLVLVLLWLGVRKRSYSFGSGKYQGWVSAHIYLGMSLVFIACLHSGLELGWNIHSFTFVLLIVVVFSGLWGTVTYLRVPKLINENLQGMTTGLMLAEIQAQEKECLLMVNKLDGILHGKVVDLLESNGIGSSLPGHDQAKRLELTLKEIAQSSSRCAEPKLAEVHQRLVEGIQYWHSMLKRYRQDQRHLGQMRSWLKLHVPFSLALLAALVSHVFSVFIYW